MTSPKFHVQTGLRIEATNMRTSGYNVTLYPANDPHCGPSPNTGCGVPVPVANNPSYIDFLPSVQIRYRLTPDSAIEPVYARGIARPDPYQFVLYATEDSTRKPHYRGSYLAIPRCGRALMPTTTTCSTRLSFTRSE